MDASAIRSVRIRTWSRARIAAFRSARSLSLSSATTSILETGPATTAGSSTAVVMARWVGATENAYPGYRCFRRRSHWLCRGGRAELVRPAQVRDPGAAAGYGPAARAAYLRRTPHPGPEAAHVLDPLAR